jgi:hypothetical protein
MPDTSLGILRDIRPESVERAKEALSPSRARTRRKT